jgi:hypothetical protein
MANNGYCKTKKKMTPELVTEVIENLIKTTFKDSVSLEKQEGGWGEYTWFISVKDSGSSNCQIFWLKNNKTFEIRHSGGTDFLRWIDWMVTNVIAVAFDGIISDDADNDKSKGEPEKYPTFEQYLKDIRFYNETKGAEEIIARCRLQDIVERTPKEHRFDTGKKIISVRKDDGFYYYEDGDAEVKAFFNMKQWKVV